MRRNNFIFDSIQVMNYKCHKVSFKRGGSYLDSPDWMKNKKAITNPKNEDNQYFQSAATATLKYDKTESHPERVSNITPFANKYNWEGINYPSKIDDLKTFEKKTPTIALNNLYIKKRNTSRTYFKT